LPTATSFDGGPVVGVLGEDGLAAIGFPVEDVFEFDDDLFEKLVRAHRLKQRRRVAELWERAKPFQVVDCT
jgi:hypothetical protein